MQQGDSRKLRAKLNGWINTNNETSVRVLRDLSQIFCRNKRGLPKNSHVGQGIVEIPFVVSPKPSF